MMNDLLNRYANLCITQAKHFSILLITLLSIACSEESSSPDVVDAPAPQLLSTTPANGATGIAGSELTVEFNFNQNISYTASGQLSISAGDAVVSSVSAGSSKLIIVLTNLAKGKTFTVIIPKGMIKNSDNMVVEQISLTFTTESEPEPLSLDAKLCTESPMKQTQQLYDYLLSIYGKKSLSGTMANVNWNIAEAELVHAATGKYPAIAFFDYIHLPWSPANWIDYSDTKVIENWWANNGLVGIGWHWNVPATAEITDVNNYSYTTGDGKQDSNGSWTTKFRPSNIFVDGSWERKVVDADLEKVAGYLKLLQDKGIPVIWRPLHEAAGNIYEYNGGKAWFWWGYDGADAYKKLWIYMFDFFKAKGINNLIWVWTSQLKDNDFYPGDDYVDIIGNDIYNKTAADDDLAQYNTLMTSYSNKLLTLSECGNVATIPQQWNAGAKWLYFMPWYDYNKTTLVGHANADDTWWKNSFVDPTVITRDGLPSLK